MIPASLANTKRFASGRHHKPIKPGLQPAKRSCARLAENPAPPARVPLCPSRRRRVALLRVARSRTVSSTESAGVVLRAAPAQTSARDSSNALFQAPAPATLLRRLR
jgi:hypothetical protein